MARKLKTYQLDYDKLLSSDPPFRCPSCKSENFKIFCLMGVTQHAWSGSSAEPGGVDRDDWCDEVDFILSVTCQECERVLMDRSDEVIALLEKEMS